MITAKQDRQNMTATVARAEETAHCQWSILFLSTVWRKRGLSDPDTSHVTYGNDETRVLVNQECSTRSLSYID